MSRVFVGIPASGEIKENIAKWSKENLSMPVRWLEGKNLHITLVPPWQEKNIPEALEKLALFANKFSNINLAFNEISFGTDPRRPRLIWASGEAPTQLVELFKQIYKTLGFELPERKLFLHITLAKFRPEDFPNFPVKKLNVKIDWKMRAKKIILYKSKLRAVGADYIPLGEVGL